MNKRKSNYSLKEQAKILKYLFSFARNQFGKFGLSVLLMFLTSAIAAYLPIIIQNYIDEHLADGTAGLRIAVQTALTYLMLLLIRMILTYVKDYTFNLASEKTVATMRNTIYQKLGGLSMEYFNQTPNGEVVSRVTNDTETIKQFWNVFLTFFDGFINAVTIAAAMFALSTSLAWVFMAFVPLVLVLIYAYQKVSTVVYGRMRVSLGKVNARLSESTTGMWLIQQFNQTERMKEEFDDINKEYVDARIKMFKMNALLLNPAVSLIEQIVLVLVIWIFGSQLLGGTAVNIGLIYAFTAYSKSFFRPISAMLDSLSVYQDGLVAAVRGIRLLDYPMTEPEQNPKAADAQISGQLAIQDLNFSYDGTTDILRGIDMNAEPGEMIAVIGHTGSGKSTIINLLMRFYEFKDGEIKLDDEGIRNYSKESLRSQIGLVLQDSFMFYGNFIDNIRLHGNYSEEEVIEAAKFSGADNFISELKDGYYTQISEGGSSLSAGQRQLISIARTILRKPRILILDEATANIDTETEQYIQRSIQNIRHESTLIVIAHRLSTIKNADKIYVLHKGRIIEQGTHANLIGRKGTYYDMYRLQTLQGLG